MGMVVELAERQRSASPDNKLVYLPNRYSMPHNVNVREASAIEYWCRHFDTTAERLLAAVKKVGTNPAIVRLELRAR